MKEKDPSNKLFNQQIHLETKPIIDVLEELKQNLQNITGELREKYSMQYISQQLDRLKEIGEYLIYNQNNIDKPQLIKQIQQYYYNLIIVIRWLSTMPSNFENITSGMIEVYSQELKKMQDKLKNAFATQDNGYVSDKKSQE